MAWTRQTIRPAVWCAPFSWNLSRGLVRLRHSRSGLLLSELGAHVISTGPGPGRDHSGSAPSARRSSGKWCHTLVGQQVSLATFADQKLTRAGGAPASWPMAKLGRKRAGEGRKVSPVWRDCASVQLQHICRHVLGAHASPADLPIRREDSPVFVPGLQWLTVMVAAHDAGQPVPALAAMRWWTQPGQIGKLPTWSRPRRCCPSAPHWDSNEAVWSTSSTGEFAPSWSTGSGPPERAPAAVHHALAPPR